MTKANRGKGNERTKGIRDETLKKIALIRGEVGNGVSFVGNEGKKNRGDRTIAWPSGGRRLFSTPWPVLINPRIMEREGGEGVHAG